jgi:two-component system cell cycle response regulator
MNAPNQSLQLLVVDDSPIARKSVEQALSPSEYSVIFANTGHDALKQFAVHRPPLVITDWLMPDFSGLELCHRIRSDFHDSFTYIILLTGVSEKGEVVRGLQAGADDYLTKPFDAGELSARVAVGRRMAELHREIEAKNHLLEQLALTDELTGLPNRRAMEGWASRQFSGALRHHFPFWVVMADLDQFKSINDTHGHIAGDAVLKKFAEILLSHTRHSDMCCRLSGDEFLLVLTYASAEGVHLAIERIRQQFESYRFAFGQTEVNPNVLDGESAGRVKVTASFGIANLRPGQDDEFHQLQSRADAALYAAKRLGRNKIQSAPTHALHF